MAWRIVDIIGVPLDLGAKTLGVELGPDAIRVAGLHHALRAAGMTYREHGNVSVPRSSDRAAPRPGFSKEVRVIASVSRVLARRVGASVRARHVPLVLGGDHSVAIGSIAGVFGERPRMGLLWLDAHPDATTPETSLSKNIHGMPLAVALGYGHASLVRAGKRPLGLDPARVVIFGAKDADPPEERFLKERGVRVITMHDIVERGVAAAFREALEYFGRSGIHHHVSFDIDVVDAVHAPGAAIPSRGGLTYREIRYCMETLGERKLVDSLDVVELNAGQDVHEETAALAVEMICAALGSRYTDYERYMEVQLAS